jgi:hypothetical protein
MMNQGQIETVTPQILAEGLFPRSRARIPLLIRTRPFFRSYLAYLLDFPVLWCLAW